MPTKAELEDLLVIAENDIATLQEEAKGYQEELDDAHDVEQKLREAIDTLKKQAVFYKYVAMKLAEEGY